MPHPWNLTKREASALQKELAQQVDISTPLDLDAVRLVAGVDVDGQGIAHPRRLGIAAHMGLWFDAPTIGCGKTWLIGEYDEPGNEKGSYAVLLERGEALGVALRTRDNVKPVFISPGHRVTIDSAREMALACSPCYRLPEPIRAADQACRVVGRK